MKYKEYKKVFTERPCQDAIDWLETQPNLVTAWDNCERGDWLWWALRKSGNSPTKETSAQYAKWCVGRAKKHAVDAAAAAAVYASVAAVYAAAAVSDASAASTVAVYAADAYADADAERLAQAEWIREHVDNPWKAGE